MKARRVLYVLVAVVALLGLVCRVYNHRRISRVAEIMGVPPDRVRFAMGALLLAGAWFTITTPEGQKAAVVCVADNGVLVSIFPEAGQAPEAERAPDGSVLWEKTAADFVSRYWPSARGKLHALAPPARSDEYVKLKLRSGAGDGGVSYEVVFYKDRLSRAQRRPPR